MNTTVLLTERYVRPRASEAPQEPAHHSYFSELIRVVFNRPTQNLETDLGTAVLFAAPHPGCGVSYICSYIAADLAASGGKVLLADAQAVLALTSRDSGRAVSLCERVEPGQVWVLGGKQIEDAGHCPPRLPSSPMAVLDLLTQEFTHIVIDAPALSVSDDALTLSAAVYGSVFVAEAGRTEKRQLTEARSKFTSLGARVFGSIYNAR